MPERSNDDATAPRLGRRAGVRSLQVVVRSADRRAGRSTSGGRVVNRCRYCAAVVDGIQRTCGPVCETRLRSWEAWIRSTRKALVYGKRPAPLPTAGKTLTQAIHRFRMQGA